MQLKAFHSIASVLAILSYMPADILGIAINDNHTIQSRQLGQVIIGGTAGSFLQNGFPGACGQVHADSDLIVAVSREMFSSSLCGQQVQVNNTQNQATVTATVADACPNVMPCDVQSLDLSIGAFNQIDGGNLGAGRVSIQWAIL